MQRIAIFLRKKGTVNKFRRAILNTLRTPLVDEAIVCSGFFQDTAKYSAGDDFDLVSFRGNSPLKLTTLGLYSYSWQTQYATFFAKLNFKNSSPSFSSVQKRISGMGWHAKVFLAKQGNKPVVAIIGSSNITSRAFGEFNNFNYECDVVIWDETIPEIERAINSAIGDDGDFSDVIVTNYDDNHKANKVPLVDRLIKLEAEVLAKAIDV